MKIGIYGGTFNPPHLGHLLIAQFILNEFRLDRIDFLPAFLTDYKKIRLDAHWRESMLRLAIRGNSHFRINSMELKAHKVCYTVDILRRIHDGTNELFLIVGNEWLGKFNQWRNYAEIFRYSRLIVARRLDIPENLPPFLRTFRKQIFFSSNPLLQISSSGIRDMRKKGMDIRYFVTPSVLKFIHRHRLYLA